MSDDPPRIGPDITTDPRELAEQMRWMAYTMLVIADSLTGMASRLAVLDDGETD